MTYTCATFLIRKLLIPGFLTACVLLIGCDRAAQGQRSPQKGGQSKQGRAAPNPSAKVPDAPKPAAATNKGFVIVEAESFVEKEDPMVVGTDADKEAESGKATFVWCPEGPGCKDISDGKGKAIVKVTIPERKRYWFWARAWSHCGCGDEYKLTLKKGAVPIEGLNGYKMAQPTHQVWQWLRRTGESEAEAGLDLDAGVYELVIQNFEDGMRIDKVLFTDLPPSEFVPVGPNPEP